MVFNFSFFPCVILKMFLDKETYKFVRILIDEILVTSVESWLLPVLQKTYIACFFI